MIMSAATTGNLFGDFMLWLYSGIGNYALTVIVFTILFKAVMSPLDVWQKGVMRKNNKAMKIMKPKLDQIKREVGENNQALYMQKQRELYKEHGYSMLGSCLPMIVTLGLFFIILGGFTAMVKYQNLTTFNALKSTYESVYDESIVSYADEDDAEARAIADAERAVVKEYETKKDKFIWIKNIFMPDTPWSDVVPDYAAFSGTGGGGMFSVKLNIKGVEKADYERIMGPITAEQNKSVNGFLILPLLCLALNILMTKLNPQAQQQPAAPPAYGQNSEAMAKQSQASMKMMGYLMPVMMFVFALFYSSAFTLYIMVSTTFSIVFNLIYNIIAKKKDKQEEDVAENTTYVRKSELEAIKKQKEKEEREKEEKEKEAKAKKILEKTKSEFNDIDKL
jgi:YidC/Oxa1 family membrane protein insertase